MQNIDLSLARASIRANKAKEQVNYNGVNCYAYGIYLSLLPEAFHLNLYRPGCFSNRRTIGLTKEDTLTNIEKDFKALNLKVQRTLPTPLGTLNKSWKVVLFVKRNKDCSLKERLEQMGGPNEIRDFHFVKINKGKYSHKMGYKNPVEYASFKDIKKKMKEKGYHYVKTYKLRLK